MNPSMNLGKYEIMEELGRGGFGVVYKARDKILERLVAVKVLHPSLINDPSFVSRFRQEAIFSARFDHPNLVPVFDFDQAEGLYYLVMGYMPGGSLKQLLKKEGALPEDRAVQILSQVGSGLAYAHRKGVIHRDLKPANILFDAENEARVSDLGFAKALRSDSSASMSMSGGMIGTPAYMAPEVWRGNLASERSDLYSLGCILYEMLTGEVLFEGETPAMAMTKHLIEGPQFHQSLPADWEPLLLNCLAMDPEARYLSVEALPMDIERAFSGTSGTVKNSQTPKEAPSEDAAEVLDEQDNLASEQSEPGLKLESVREAEDVVGTPTQITLRTKRESDKTAQAVDSANKSGKKELLGALFGAFLTIAVTVTILVFLSKHWSALTNPPIKTEVRQKDGMTMVYVPAGKFEMGSEDGYSDEKPVHTVELSAYWIDKYEVSNGQYAKCVAAGVCTKPSSTGSNKRSSYYDDPEYENYPVIYVDWHQASAYCQWAGGQLPTEAEWEKAARGTDGRTWPWGNQNPNCNLVNFDNCEGDTSPVTDYKEGASPYGALNMAGNVWKWVRDVYSNSYPSGQVKDPTGPTDGDRRVLRGGSWVNVDRVIRAANRNYSYPTSTFNNYGFRCILPQP